MKGKILAAILTASLAGFACASETYTFGIDLSPESKGLSIGIENKYGTIFLKNREGRKFSKYHNYDPLDTSDPNHRYNRHRYIPPNQTQFKSTIDIRK